GRASGRGARRRWVCAPAGAASRRPASRPPTWCDGIWSPASSTPTTTPARAIASMRIPGDSSPASVASDPPAEPEPPERLALTLVEEDGDWSGFGPLEEAAHQAAAALARYPRVPL